MYNIRDRNILLWGAGGGFDIYAGFFLYQHLIQRNKVYLANYSFTDDLYKYGDDIIVEITGSETKTLKNRDYFPEYDLAVFLKTTIYAARLFGPRDIIPALNNLCTKLSIDLIIAIDAGHDALLFGDEYDTRGSPLEDMVSIISIAQLSCEKILCCVSVPTEGIPMVLFWQHLELMRQANGFIGKYLYGTSSETNEFKKLLDSTDAMTRSIPNESLLAAMENRYGEHYYNPRLRIRMKTDDCNELDYPNVTIDTKYHWFFDIDILTKTSPLISHLIDKGQKLDAIEFNQLINEYYYDKSDVSKQ
jgi:hypothetical protein